MAKPYRVTAYVRFSNAINSSLVRLGMMGYSGRIPTQAISM